MIGHGTWEAAVESAADSKKKGGGFQSFNLEKPLLDAILKQGFSVPTPIQRKAIPPMLQGNDVVAMARTGSGKTAAFLIPMLNTLKAHAKIVGIRGLVLSPTRELSLQILRNGFALNKFLDLRFAALVGGDSMDQQFELLASNPDVVVATPGRLLHIMEEASLHLTSVRCLVLDEADRLFELGLQPQIGAIMQKLPESCQRALFSATMPTVLAEFTSAGLHNPVVIRLDSEMKLSDQLKQSAFLVRNDEKVAALIVLLKRVLHVGEAAANNAQALIFVESKFHVEFLQMILTHYSISTSAVHGQMDQEARRLAVRSFAKRETSVMVVTDVAARGLDLPLLDNVVNFSFPFNPKLFVHRVGRVARAGRSGTAYSIMTFEDFPYYIDLLQFIGRPLQSAPVPGDLLFTPDNGCYGRLPEEDIQLELDFLKRLHENDVEVRSMARVVENAHKKFNRTKKKPTHEAIQEARKPQYAFDRTPLHPMLLERVGSTRVRADEARFDLKRFKPKELFLEIGSKEKLFEIRPPETAQSLARSADAEGGATKRGAASAAPPAKQLSFAEQMLQRAQERRKREREVGSSTSVNSDDAVMNLVTQPREAALGQEESMETGAYRDENFFMDLERRDTLNNAHYSLKDATMDMTAETAEEAAQQRQVFAWSKKKNRYVQMHVNDAKALLRGVKNEAGKAINYKSKLQAYSKWMKKSNMRIQDVGEEEDLVPLKRAKAAALSSQPQDGDVGNGDDDFVDISDPNQGKKLRIGRKQKRLPKDGHVRSFEEMAARRRKAEKEKSRLARKNQRSGSGKKKSK
ncbi:ATP-dependent RNA helicase, putative [Leishmania donovani]|uniref:Probable eukaryotic initiation factor 4A n=1 Tax=Leishmania donovani TaxID=5661 RepID=A0A3S7X7Z2_LEIDO|nr:ATP-dependent RNA helicase, putative [Leishmania donovani]AYU82534.1 ATP-dependent RNA helicase, putative [Leishmania donovani]TPP40090.1 DEAD/DEAH box helicase family protein [Leishmania donovani]CBZ37658.1 ATP-dependent RNA helicase, putative [Leishmania donovani]